MQIIMRIFSNMTTDIYSNSFDFKSNGGSRVYEYDGNGSLSSDPYKGFAFEYDLLGNLKQTESNYTTSYVYSSTGERLSVESKFNGCIAKPCFYALDHLGSVRLVVSADGQVMERSDYYPSGCMITGNIINEGNIQPYKYNGKELDPMHGLYTYDYGARQYDPATTLWDRMDPLCEENPEVSPYVFCGDNPVNRIDADGMDWYQDKDKTWQYSPKVHSQKDLAEGQIYKGKSFFTVNGTNLVQYRSDGSILYANETSAYNRMWDQADRHYRSLGEKGGREVGGFILSNGKVLVLPDYMNDSRTTGISVYGYNLDGLKLIHNKESLPVIGQIHTHQNKSLPPSPSFYMVNGYGDLGLSMNNSSLPVFTIGHDGKIYGIRGKFVRNGKKVIPTGYDIPLEHRKYSRTNLLNGTITITNIIRRLPKL